MARVRPAKFGSSSPRSSGCSVPREVRGSGGRSDRERAPGDLVPVQSRDRGGAKLRVREADEPVIPRAARGELTSDEGGVHRAEAREEVAEIRSRGAVSEIPNVEPHP